MTYFFEQDPINSEIKPEDIFHGCPIPRERQGPGIIQVFQGGLSILSTSWFLNHKGA